MKPKIPVNRTPIVVCTTFSISTNGDTLCNTSESMPAIFLRLTERASPYSSNETLELTAEVKMTNIKMDGDNIKFTIVGFSDDSTPPVATNIKVETFMDAAIISFESSWEYLGDATLTWGRSGQNPDETLIKPYEPGKYALILKGLIPGNKTYTANICFHIGDIEGERRNISFMTSKKAPVDWPYIFI